MTQPNSALDVWKHISVGADSECWIWNGRLTDRGYGSFDLQGHSVRAHRIVYELSYGPIPAGLEVLHSCGVRCCCNPAHLRVGTHAENMKTRKGKFTQEQIEDIRASDAPQDELAYVYGVNQSTISRIRRHKRFYQGG